MRLKSLNDMRYVSANEVERDDLPRAKSPVSQKFNKLAARNEMLERENANLRGVYGKNFNADEFKPHSTKSPITFTYSNNRIAYWKDGYWYDNDTDEEVPDKWTGKVSPNYGKTSNDETGSETSNDDYESEGAENEKTNGNA